MKKNVFVDGQHGTTGLKIRERLADRNDIEIIEIPEEKRKDPNARAELLNSVDIAFLCLPDDAARESVSLVNNPEVCIIDGSTAHRVTDGWVYGLPELKEGQREMIKESKRISVPGCHATGCILILHAPVHDFIHDVFGLARIQGLGLEDFPLLGDQVLGQGFLIDGLGIGRGDVHGQIMHEFEKLIGLGHEIGFAVDFYQYSQPGARVDVRGDQALPGGLAYPFLGRRDPFLTQDLHRFIQIAP